MRKSLFALLFSIGGLCFFLAPRAQAAISLVEAKCGAGTITFSTSTTSGELIVVGAALGGGTNNATSTTDNKSDTYTNIASTSFINYFQAFTDLYYAYNVAAGVTSVTVNPNGNTDNEICAAHYTGISTSNPLDNATAFSANSGTPWNSPTSTPTGSSDLAVGFAAESSNQCVSTFTINSPFTVRVQNGQCSGPSAALADDILSSSNPISMSGSTTGGAGSGNVAVVATFNAAGAPASGFAWGDWAGWVNFATLDGNFQVNASTVTGYAWSQNFGWINLAPASSGVTNDGKGGLGGYAWNTNFGWVSFSGVSISSSTGVFNGTATFAGNASGIYGGSIYFGCAECLVETSWRPASTTGITISTPTVNGGVDPIVLNPATTTLVTVTSTITDSNGAGAITYATSTFYRNGVGATCTADPLDCYQIPSSSCVFSGSTSTVTCTANVWYFAQSTGGATGNASSTYPSDSWKAAITVGDSTGATSTAVSNAVDVGVLTAVDIGANASISYGTLGAGATTATGQEPTTTVQNAGNSSTTLSVWGTDLTAGGGGGGIAYVQSTSTLAGVQIATDAFGSDVKKGDVIVVGTFNDIGAPVTATDTLGDTFVEVASSTAPGDHDALILVATTNASGTDAVTLNAGSGKSIFVFSIHEYSGIVTSSIAAMIDASSTNSSAAYPGSTNLSTGNVTTTNANDLVFAWFTNGNDTSNNDFTYDPLYTRREHASGITVCVTGNCLASEDLILTQTTSTNATATIIYSDVWTASAVAFKAASTGGNSIPVSSEHYATSSFTYGGSEPVLSSSSAPISGFLLAAPTSTNAVSSLVYWGITVPSSTPTGTYSGVNAFVYGFSP